MEDKDEKERRHTDINESWKSQEMKPGPSNRLCGPFVVFRHGVHLNNNDGSLA